MYFVLEIYLKRMNRERATFKSTQIKYTKLLHPAAFLANINIFLFI